MAWKPGPFFNQWRSIRDAVYNTNSSNYRDYYTCYWGPKDYKEFEKYALKHIGPRPSKQHKLIRKNQTKGYEPGNLVWETHKVLANKMLYNCVFITFRNKTLSAKQWSETLGIPYRRIIFRIKQNWPAKYILSNKKFKKGEVCLDQ